MPMVWVGAQLLLVSARTDPLDREELLSTLLAWAVARTRASNPIEPVAIPAAPSLAADPALLRALIVAWSVRPDLTVETLPKWLAKRLFTTAETDALNAAVSILKDDGVLDAQGQPQAEQVAGRVRDWGLRAWVREAHQLEQE